MKLNKGLTKAFWLVRSIRATPEEEVMDKLINK